ncbi:MAG TPA: hypothetical protein VD789_08690 [Thermomicrobiales bacterium]|nr:hypothetical protein [Thermomicrobiales bacterium]
MHAVLDYGSTSEGRGDAWSDIDLALSIRSDAWGDFNADWRAWLSGCGPVLLGFTSFVDHPWAVLGSDAWPVRVDLHLYGGPPDEDLIAALPDWPNAPTSVDAMLLFDRHDALGDAVAAKVGSSIALADFAATFASTSGHFWYYVHRTWSKLHRDSRWDVRWGITYMLIGNLCALLRLESGATERWLASDAASGIETAISEERLARLNACIPGVDDESLLAALEAIIDLGAEVCESIASEHDLPWPADLARIMRELVT